MYTVSYPENTFGKINPSDVDPRDLVVSEPLTEEQARSYVDFLWVAAGHTAFIVGV